MSRDESTGEGRPSDAGGFDVSRRRFLSTGAAAGAAAALGSEGAAAAPKGGHGSHGRGPRGRRRDDSDLVLVNGEIHTMDDEDSVVSAVAIRNGRFAEVGHGARARGPNTQVVDLHGRTVVPGIVDNHNHVVLMGLRPGYHTPLENANSIEEVQATLRARRPDVPSGAFITTIGGFHPNQFEEGRLPTLSELDEAVDDRPVYVQVSFLGPSTTNSLGRAFFEGEGVAVGDDGSIEDGEPTGRALLALRGMQTFEDKLRSTRDAMDYAASLGVTTHLDQGAFPATGTPSDGAAHADLYEMHEAFLSLHRAGELSIRLRINFLNLETDPDTPKLRARLRNAFQFFGDEMVRTGGIGEFTAGTPFELIFGDGPSEAWINGTHRVAEAGWRNENHSLTPTDFQPIVETWEDVNDEHDVTDLRWVLAHANFITEEYIDRLDALGGGLSLTGYQYLDGSTQSNGPPFRTIVDSDVRVGMSSDSAQIAPLNPWLHMYYAVTGRNSAGDLINDGQQIPRNEVLRLYTAANGWFMREEDRLGTIEPRKLGDLVVLSDDYFSVGEEEIKDVRSVLTVLGGDVVHDAGELRQAIELAVARDLRGVCTRRNASSSHVSTLPPQGYCPGRISGCLAQTIVRLNRA